MKNRLLQLKLTENLDQLGAVLGGIQEHLSNGFYKGSEGCVAETVVAGVVMQSLVLEALEVNDAVYSKEIINLSSSMIENLAELLVGADE